MAFNVSNLTDYTGKSKSILTEKLLFSDSYANFSTQTGIKFKEYLNYLDNTVEIQAGVCDLDPSGTTVLTEKEVQVYPMSILQKWCLSDLDKKSVTAEVGTGKGNWNNDLKTVLVSNLVDKAKVKLDKWIFQGNTGSGDLFNGLVTKFATDSDVIDVTTTSAVTAANIDGYITEMLMAVTQDLFTNGLLTLHGPMTYFNLYRQNRITSNMYHDDPKYKGLNMMDIFGGEGTAVMKAEPGLVGNTHMFLTYDSNIVMLYDEVNEVVRAEMFFVQKERNVYYSAAWKIGVDYYYGKHVVLFTTSA